MLKKLDKFLVVSMHRYSITILRVALGIVFLWFGILKIIGQSPVAGMVNSTFSFFGPHFLLILGIWEVLIGMGLIFKLYLRATLFLLWLQILGTLSAPVLAPQIFFHGNFFLLTADGEFVIKNLVLIAASLVIAGFELKPEK
jgi:uncharacterized membrane protein YkgB